MLDNHLSKKELEKAKKEAEDKLREKRDEFKASSK